METAFGSDTTYLAFSLNVNMAISVRQLGGQRFWPSGDGHRVVTGAILASSGSLVVGTRGPVLRLTPKDDGAITRCARQPVSWQESRECPAPTLRQPSICSSDPLG